MTESDDVAFRLSPRRKVEPKEAGAATLARGLLLLETFQQALRPMTHGELAELSGLTGPTVTRLASALETLGYLRRRSDRRWELTPDVLSLGYPKLVGSRLRRLAHPYLLEIARQGDLTLAIAEPSDIAMVYIESCSVSTGNALRLDVGARLDMAKSATGQTYLATVDDDQRAELFKLLKARHKKAWPKLSGLVDKARAELDARGFIYSDGQWRPDTRAVASPLVTEGGSQVYVLNCAAPRFAVSEARMIEELGPRIVGLCRHLRDLLG
ncbi:MAG: helix-turn-helix domain-containing protein [Alphaproteobacteria bacterium]|nr:helix-turn-helix domain-containing protein [Alphaproteobacteria bacterium]